ncbi:unnamed protein product, partial [Notodromas monacha]
SYLNILRYFATDHHGRVKQLILPKALDLDRPKRARTWFTSAQLQVLETEYSKLPYITGQDRKALAIRLGLSETQVKVWYQNRRTKSKKEKSGDSQQQMMLPSSSSSAAELTPSLITSQNQAASFIKHHPGNLGPSWNASPITSAFFRNQNDVNRNRHQQPWPSSQHLFQQQNPSDPTPMDPMLGLGIPGFIAKSGKDTFELDFYTRYNATLSWLLMSAKTNNNNNSCTIRQQEMKRFSDDMDQYQNETMDRLKDTASPDIMID